LSHPCCRKNPQQAVGHRKSQSSWAGFDRLSLTCLAWNGREKKVTLSLSKGGAQDGLYPVSLAGVGRNPCGFDKDWAPAFAGETERRIRFRMGQTRASAAHEKRSYISEPPVRSGRQNHKGIDLPQDGADRAVCGASDTDASIEATQPSHPVAELAFRP